MRRRAAVEWGPHHLRPSSRYALEITKFGGGGDSAGWVVGAGVVQLVSGLAAAGEERVGGGPHMADLEARVSVGDKNEGDHGGPRVV